MEFRVSKNSKVRKENKHPSLEGPVMLPGRMGSVRSIAGGRRRTDLIYNFKSLSCRHYLCSSADSRPTQLQERELR